MSGKITLNVKQVEVIIQNSGTDRVSIELEGETPFPELGYPGYANVEVRHGYGVEWCRKALGVEPKVIDARRAPTTPFLGPPESYSNEKKGPKAKK